MLNAISKVSVLSIEQYRHVIRLEPYHLDMSQFVRMCTEVTKQVFMTSTKHNGLPFNGCDFSSFYYLKASYAGLSVSSMLRWAALLNENVMLCSSSLDYLLYTPHYRGREPIHSLGSWAVRLALLSKPK